MANLTRIVESLVKHEAIATDNPNKMDNLVKCMNELGYKSLSRDGEVIENKSSIKKIENPKLQLTENGVLILYNQLHKQILNMQVIFLFRTNIYWYLRLSDGKFVSPIIRLYKKNCSEFSVGAVLSIKEIVICHHELDSLHVLEDPQISRVLIKDYHVLEPHTSFSSILGQLNQDFTYRDSIQYISDLLIKKDPKLEKYFKQEAKHYEQLKEDGERFRERGNALFKKKNVDQAIIHFDMAKQKNQYDYRVWSDLSQVHFNSGEFKKAEDEALMAIKLNPFSEKAYHQAGKAAMKQSGKEAAVEYTRSGILICNEDRDLLKLLEECTGEPIQLSIPKQPGLTAFCSDKGLEKLKQLVEEKKARDKNSEVTKDTNKATTIETNSPDTRIKEVLSDKDSSSKCSWERLETKAGVVPPSDDDNIATVIDPMEDLNEKSDSISTCSRSGGIATFNLNIKNFNKLTDAKYSQTCYVRNFPWNILFVPKLDRGTILLVFVLQCNGDTDSTSWSCDANVIVKGKKPAIWKIDKKKFCSKEIKMAFYPSMDWDEVINPENGYIKDDTITVEVHLKVRTKKLKQITNTTIEEEARKEEAKLKEEERKKKLRAIPKDPYHKTIYEGRKLYEQGQYCQALDLFGKPVPAKRNINATKVKFEGVIVQFLLGICKIQSGKSFILDGMDIMKSLINAKSSFPSAPAAHYWLGIGYEKIYLLKLAQHHGFLCSDSLNSSSTYKGISWPGSDDFIPETVPDTLARLAKELLGRVASTKPTPKARCRFKNCIGTQSTPYAKEEIYSSDPDFKGYLDIICEENCSISYHPCCWKAYKESQEDYHGKMTDKDFVDQSCMTPDCCGKICSIHIYDETDRLKNVIQKDKDKKEIKGSSILSKQKNKKEKKEKRTTKNDSKTKNKTENQNEANKENRDKENMKEESISKKDSLGTNHQEDSKARFIIPTQSAAPPTPKKEKSPSPKKEKSPTTTILPIDPESLATEKVTILVPLKEDENVWEKTTTKKNKKKKKNKQSNNNNNVQQTDNLGDPVEADKAQRNEYLVRLRLLKQQREYYNDSKLKNGTQSQYKQVLQWLDPENPFYLPQHLRDNAEELEHCLQTKMTTTTGPDISQDTIVTLLSFMYDWLKEQGPMSINDSRIREYVVENFPPEGKNHINMCGSIKEFLMQSIDFALIDDVICVRDHVIQAQELTLKTTLERMSSKYLLSDGKKAKKLVHLLDEDFKSPEDVKSTSSTSSSSHIIDSTVSLNSYNASVSNSTNHSVSLEAQKLSTPLLELNNNANSPKEMKKIRTGGMGGLDDFEMPELTNGGKGENQITGSQDTVVVSSDVGVHRNLDNILIGGTIPVSKTLPNNCVNRTPPDSPITPDVRDSPDILLSPAITLTSLAQETEDEEVFNSDDEDIFQENQNVTFLEAEVSQLRRELQQQESQCHVLSVQNEELSDKFHQHKTRANLDLGLLKKQIEELNEKFKSAEAERASVSALRESEQKKFNSERSRMQEEVKNLQSRNASLELQHDRANDRIHELEQKLSNEMVAHVQLKEEMKSLQDSLISSSRRSHEAEVKYLCTKKDLVEQNLTRTVDRLSKEVARMRQLLVHANDNTVPDHSTLSQSIVAWDAHIANIQMVIKSFVEQGVKFLGLVNQGRPLSALPAGDLQVPPIQDINVADLLCLGQKAKANITGSGPPTNLSLGASNNVDVSDSPSTPASVLKHGGLGAHYLGSPTAGMDMHPSYARNGPTANAFNNASLINGCPGKTLIAQIGNWPDSHQLFVGQLPWNYSEDDMKTFFTEQFGEVVSVTIYDKHRNPDGKTVPKYGFVVFRNAEDRDKALNKKPIMIKNHIINVQAKEPSSIPPSKTTGPPPGLSLPSHLCLAASLVTETAIGSNLIPPAPVTVQPTIALTSNTTSSTTTYATTPGAVSSTAVRCLEDVSLKANSETIKNTGVTRSGTVATPTQSTNTTPTSIKPKFQHLTTSNVSTIGTPPPKLVRPQPSRPGGGLTTSLSQSTTARGGSRTVVSSVEDSGVSGGNAYKKLVEVCKQRLGQEYAHPEIYTALREVRQRNNSTLSGLSLDVIVDRVRIQLRSRRPGSGGASVAPWASLMHSSSNTGSVKSEWQGTEVLAPEDQCSICLEALASAPTVALQCKHVFHERCIKDWLKRQSNCPNCRKFALMSDEYPSLS